MQVFIALLLQCSVSMSVVSLVWMGLLPFLSRRYEAKWLYGICLLLFIGWMIPCICWPRRLPRSVKFLVMHGYCEALIFSKENNTGKPLSA